MILSHYEIKKLKYEIKDNYEISHYYDTTSLWDKKLKYEIKDNYEISHYYDTTSLWD